MIRSVAASLASALLLSLAAAGNANADSATNSTSSWLSAFQGRAFPVAAPADTCKVCFYEEPNYGGASYCVGKRAASCTEVAPIAAPGSIASVKFFTSADDCELVANIRVTVPPYDQKVDLVTADVPATGYDFVVQELYVEPAGRACFLAVVDGGHYGRCYTESVSAVEPRYRGQFHEVLLFRTPATDFYVVAFEGQGFDAQGLYKRFAASDADLGISASGGKLVTLDGKIESVQYVGLSP